MRITGGRKIQEKTKFIKASVRITNKNKKGHNTGIIKLFAWELYKIHGNYRDFPSLIPGLGIRACNILAVWNDHL